MSMKQLQEQIVKDMARWQKIEDATVSATSAIMEKTENPVVRLVMEIIQQDSRTHHRVQQLVIDTLERGVRLDTDELAGISELIEQHVEMEKDTVDRAEAALETLEGSKLLVPEYLLNYLAMDEKKHVAMLTALTRIKAGMYPYA